MKPLRPLLVPLAALGIACSGPNEHMTPLVPVEAVVVPEPVVVVADPVLVVLVGVTVIAADGEPVP